LRWWVVWAAGLRWWVGERERELREKALRERERAERERERAEIERERDRELTNKIIVIISRAGNKEN